MDKFLAHDNLKVRLHAHKSHIVEYIQKGDVIEIFDTRCCPGIEAGMTGRVIYENDGHGSSYEYGVLMENFPTVNGDYIICACGGDIILK
jgi:hypothetical protein